MDIKISTILRESFELNSEVQNFVTNCDEVILHSQFGGKVRKTKRNKFQPVMPADKANSFLEQTGLWKKKISLFLPAKSSIYDIADFQKYFHLERIYIECDESHGFSMTKKLLTSVLKSRLVNQIGLVAPVDVLRSEAIRMEFADELGNAAVSLCPIFGDGATSLGQMLGTLSEEMPGCNPVLLAMSTDDKPNFASILARYEGKFERVVFWTPHTMRGVVFEKKEVEPDDIYVERPNYTLYKALQPVALRERPTRGANCKGTVAVGEVYRVVGTPHDDRMGTVYGLLDTGDWVALSSTGVDYFKRE